MVSLRGNPFYLKDEDIVWVKETLSSMTLEEKIGQLFIMLDQKKERAEERRLLQEYHLGGCRYENEDAQTIYEQNKYYQECAKIPLLIACNCDSGGDGASSSGTYVASAAACGAASDTKVAENTGYVSGVEAWAVGCNWNFGPVCDIKFNWRNTIVNTRAYSSDADTVLANARAYIRGMRRTGMAVTAKHFPGDGVEELDQHLVMGVNNLSCEEWEASFGKVYRALIQEDGVEAVMAGHIALPSYERKYNPDIQDCEILPATLSPVLLKKLLREELGFNGLIVSDATHMGGMTCSLPRKDQVPGAIAAGCDMFLFFNNIEEDFQYMMDGYKNGVISEERLNEAVTRILAFKARLGLHKRQRVHELVPPIENLAMVGCEAHRKLADDAAKRTITLVKDMHMQLPISPETHRRAYVIVVSNPPEFGSSGENPDREKICCKLEEFGYETTVHENYYDQVQKSGPGREAFLKSMKIGSVESFKKQYDVVFVFINVGGFGQKNNVRLEWSSRHSAEIPWYVQEVPTVFISLNYTNHLLDLPMAKTFINAYALTDQVMEHLLKKIAGQESFDGHYEDQVFCGRWDART